MYDFKEWNHVFKLDPAKPLSDQDLEQICESGTDAIIVGGSDNITLDNTLQMLSDIRRYSVPCVLEVSDMESITPGFDLYFIPTVLNSTNKKWIVDLHHQAVKEYGDIMNWDEIVMEGYCILNNDSKAAKLTEANGDLTAEDVMAYATMSEKMFNLPIFYIEYSGMFGDMDLLKQVKSKLKQAKLFYGGGIKTAEQAMEASRHADTVIVGNGIYDDIKEALKTVEAVKG